MSMAEVIESIEKDMWKQIDARTIGEEPPSGTIDCTTLGDELENPKYCCTCKFYDLDNGTCMNKKSDFYSEFQNLDSTCGYFE